MMSCPLRILAEKNKPSSKRRDRRKSRGKEDNSNCLNRQDLREKGKLPNKKDSKDLNRSASKRKSK
jgi:hypothetical protein